MNGYVLHSGIQMNAKLKNKRHSIDEFFYCVSYEYFIVDL